jgi:hypothetical protein
LLSASRCKTPKKNKRFVLKFNAKTQWRKDAKFQVFLKKAIENLF